MNMETGTVRKDTATLLDDVGIPLSNDGVDALRDVGIVALRDVGELAGVGTTSVNTHDLAELNSVLSGTSSTSLGLEELMTVGSYTDSEVDGLQLQATLASLLEVDQQQLTVDGETTGRWTALMAWARANASQISYTKVFLSCSTLAAVCTAAYFGDLNVWSFLALLKATGLTTKVPELLVPIAMSAARSLGTSVGITQLFNLAKKNASVRRSLDAKVPKGYLLSVLKGLGITPTDTLTYQELYSAVGLNLLDNASLIATGDVSGYLMVVAQSAGLAAVKRAAPSVMKRFKGEQPTPTGMRQSAATVAVDRALNLQRPIITDADIAAVSSDLPDPSELHEVNTRFAGPTVAGAYTVAPAAAVTGAAITAGLLGAAFSGTVATADATAAAKSIIGTILQSGLSSKLITTAEKRLLTGGRASSNPLSVLHSFVGGSSATKVVRMTTITLNRKLVELGHATHVIRGMSTVTKRKILIADFTVRVQRLESILLRAVVTATVSALSASLVEQAGTFISKRGDTQLEQSAQATKQEMPAAQGISAEGIQPLRQDKAAIRAAAREASAVGTAKAAESKVARAVKHQAALERARTRAAARTARLAERQKLRDLNTDTVIVRPDGTAHAIPHESQLIDERLADEVDFTMVPLGYKIGESAVNSLLGAIPFYGNAQAAIDITNNMLDSAWAVNKMASVLAAVKGIDSDIDADAVHMNIPDPVKKVKAAAREILGAEFNVKDELLKMMKDAVVEGWSSKQVAARMAALTTGGKTGVAAYELSEKVAERIGNSMASILEFGGSLF